VAYLCTYEQTDPLFAFDLSDPANPVKLGEMKITGFSDYLHVWADGRLFGLGQAATEQGQVTGMKMVMFDVSDKTSVSVKATLDLGDTYSEALNDPNAILVSPDKNLIGFATNSGYTFYSYSDDAGFTKLASVAGSDWDYNMRGLYIGDFLYIVSQSGVTVVELPSYTTVATVAV
ncbi:MAG: beta-propeller domain-containing protein, partial [Oscillospiraceae bacterium]|nr:beta-propeller domain-containing protein [Oscillospiraceae bacterium]